MEALGHSSRAEEFLEKFSLQMVVVAYVEFVGTKVCASRQNPNNGRILMGT